MIRFTARCLVVRVFDTGGYRQNKRPQPQFVGPWSHFLYVVWATGERRRVIREILRSISVHRP